MSIVSRDILSLHGGVGPAGTPGRSLREIARSRRIVLLIFALVLMSVADLLCTISYLTSVGMVEMNPIARHMIEIGGVRQLVLFKAFTMTLSCGCIYLIRKRRGAELGAWVCVAVLLSLMLHWLQYNAVMHTLAPHFSSISLPGTAFNSDWVIIRE
jgi:hypothetical protein